MSEVTTETVATETTETEAVTAQETETQETTTEETVEDPAAGLKSALQKERASNKAHLKRIKELEREAEDRDKSPDEKALDDARREAASEATAKANKRLVAAEFRSAAAKRVKDPRIAVKLVDLDGIDVDDDGNVDADGITAALDALLEEYPDLAPSRFNGTADQGGVGKSSRLPQLTADDLSTMSPEQVVAARKEGLLDNLLGVKK
ncbi:hypothetical protein K0U83_01410 [bacterium]|nr:hypothetical protein [bacterium]